MNSEGTDMRSPDAPRSAPPAGDVTDPMTAGRGTPPLETQPARESSGSASRTSSAEGSGSTSKPGAGADTASKADGQEAVVLVRGETVKESDSKAPAKDAQAKPAMQVSPEKLRLKQALPALADDGDVGQQKEHVVTRDGKADIAFSGSLLASAGPDLAPKNDWQEYRVYETSGGKYVFSKTKRSVFIETQDGHEAEVFDPSPESMPTRLLRSVRDVALAGPMTWKDAAVDYFGYDPLAKVLYRKLGHQFEEHID